MQTLVTSVPTVANHIHKSVALGTGHVLSKIRKVEIIRNSPFLTTTYCSLMAPFHSSTCTEIWKNKEAAIWSFPSTGMGQFFHSVIFFKLCISECVLIFHPWHELPLPATGLKDNKDDCVAII